jgi:lipoprotein LprG
LVVGGTAVLGLTGCGDDEGDPPEDLQGRLDNAKQSMDEAESIEFTMSTDDLPDGVIGLLNAEGVGTHDPAFEGEVQVATAGTSVSADLISVGGDVYAKIAFAPAYIALDPADYGAPDPAALLDRETGVSTFLTETDDVAGGEQTREGEEVLTTISGTLPGEVVQSLIPSAEAGAEFDVEYRLTDGDELRTAVITGPFYPDAEDVTYSLSLDPSDETVEITPP